LCRGIDHEIGYIGWKKLGQWTPIPPTTYGWAGANSLSDLEKEGFLLRELGKGKKLT